MNMFKAITASAALAMLAAQPVAAANSAQKLSLTNAVKSDVRASAKAGKNKAFGVSTIAILAGVAVIVGVVLIASDSDSDSN